MLHLAFMILHVNSTECNDYHFTPHVFIYSKNKINKQFSFDKHSFQVYSKKFSTRHNSIHPRKRVINNKIKNSPIWILIAYDYNQANANSGALRTARFFNSKNHLLNNSSAELAETSYVWFQPVRSGGGCKFNPYKFPFYTKQYK